MLTSTGSILALDVGGKRIGVAVANAIARIASPLTTLQNDAAIMQNLQELIRKQDVTHLVLGLPRGLHGQRTAQTEAVEVFAAELKRYIDIPLYWQDEAVTSRQAEAELSARGKPYRKEAIDVLAATYILEDFLAEQFSPASAHPEQAA